MNARTTIRLLNIDDADAFRALRLAGLRSHPEAYATVDEDWRDLPRDRLEAMLQQSNEDRDLILGAPPQLGVHDFASSQDHVVGLYRMRVTRDGTSYERPHVNVYHVRDGKIVEFWWSPFDTEAARKALG